MKRPNTGATTIGWRSAAASLGASAFLGWCAFEGARGLLRIWASGMIRNRRGPDVTLDADPLVFWGLSGFYGAGILLAGGLALLCLLIAVHSLSRKTDA